MTVGIYCLVFENTNKVYIGKSTNIEQRFSSHLSSMRAGSSPRKLQSAYNTFKEPTCEILCECREEELLNKEKELIIEFDSVLNGFNTSNGGDAGAVLHGEDNGRALSDNLKYVEVLTLLTSTNFSRYKIAEITGVSVSVVSHISSGEGHKWLKTKYPEMYEKLLSLKKEGRRSLTKTSKRKFNTLVSPEGTYYDVSRVSLKNFCEEHSLTYSKASGILNGHSLYHKGWRAE